MYDYSSLRPLGQEIANSPIPGVSNLREVPEAVTAVSTAMSQQEDLKLANRGGDALAEKAPLVGVDPNFIKLVYKADPVKAYDYMIQATEKYNTSQAEEYVGKELGSDEFDPTKFSNEDGTPMGPELAMNKFLGERRGRITKGMQEAQSPYVRRAYEDRLTKLDKTGASMKDQYAMNRDFRAAQKAMVDNVSKIMKESGMGESINTEAGNVGFVNSMKDIDDSIVRADKNSKDGTTVGIYTLGPGEAILNQTGVFNDILNAWMSPTNKADSGSFSSKTIQYLKSYLDKGTDSMDALNKAAEDIVATGDPRSKEAVEINGAINSVLAMRVFEQIHALTGAAMSEGERAGYLRALRVGGPEGAAGVMRDYNLRVKEKNIQRKYAKEEAKAKLLRTYMGNSSDPGYIYGAQMIDAVKPLEPIPQHIIDRVSARFVLKPMDRSKANLAEEQTKLHGTAPTAEPVAPPDGAGAPPPATPADSVSTGAPPDSAVTGTPTSSFVMPSDSTLRGTDALYQWAESVGLPSGMRTYDIATEAKKRGLKVGPSMKK